MIELKHKDKIHHRLVKYCNFNSVPSVAANRKNDIFLYQVCDGYD